MSECVAAGRRGAAYVGEGWCCIKFLTSKSPFAVSPVLCQAILWSGPCQVSVQRFWFPSCWGRKQKDLQRCKLFTRRNESSHFNPEFVQTRRESCGAGGRTCFDMGRRVGFQLNCCLTFQQFHFCNQVLHFVVAFAGTFGAVALVAYISD